MTDRSTTHESVDLRDLLRIDIEAELRKLTVAQLQGDRKSVV